MTDETMKGGPMKEQPPVPLANREDDISIVRVVSVLLKRRRTVVGSAFAIGLVAVLFALLTFTPTYTSEASFFSQGTQQGGASGLQALAGRFGVTVPADAGNESPEFHAALLNSREILKDLLVDTFTVQRVQWGDTVRAAGTIADLLEIDEERVDHRREEGIRWLKEDAVSTSVDRETGVVRLTVRTPWPNMSQEIAARLLDLVNDFNLRTRQNQASAERAFIERRLSEAHQELTEAEQELELFLEQNRTFQNSPQLVFQHDRLQRRVAMRQEVYTSLSHAHEEARISEVRNTPVITVVEPPEEPVKGDPRQLGLRGILGLLVGGALGVFAAMGREFLARSRKEDEEDYGRLQEAWNATKDDLRRIVPGIGQQNSQT